MKLIICKGLPGSGKSTWAKSYKAIDPTLGLPLTVRIVNKDSIRRELEEGGWQWSREAEKDVIKIRDEQIITGLRVGMIVISDDTNLAPKHPHRLIQIAKECNADVEFKDFTDVPLEECIRRDRLRTGKARVGEQVIVNMYKQYVEPKPKDDPIPELYVPNHLKPKAIICDLDGTLCLHNGRGPFEYDKCDTDLVNVPVSELLHGLYGRYGVIYLSGREDTAKKKSHEWLDRHNCPPGPLFMRKAGDFRKDYIVKYELFNEHIRNNYNVLFALDDRDQVVKLWRDMGLTCLQVAYGNF